MALRRKIKKKVTNPMEIKKQNVKKKKKTVKTKIVNSQKLKKPTVGKGMKVKPQDLKLKRGNIENPKHLVPFNKGWTREVVYRNVVSKRSKTCDIYYISPGGKKCRSSINIIPELKPGLTLDNFSFAPKPLGVNDPHKEVIRRVAAVHKVSPHENKHTPTKDLKKEKQAVNRASSSSKAKTSVSIRNKANQRPKNNATIKARSRKPVSEALKPIKKHVKVTNRNASSKSVVANPVSNRAKPCPKKNSTPKDNTSKPKLRDGSQSNISRKSRRSKMETKSKSNLLPKVILKKLGYRTYHTSKRKYSSESDDSCSDSDIGVDPKLFHCFHCGYSCGTKPLLRSHMSSHIRDFKKLSCYTCGYRATKHSDLLAHQLIHMDHKPFECYHCDYKAKKREYLRRHIETHLGIRRFACPKCDYRSNSSYATKKHVQGHSMEQRFKCKYCEFQTVHLSNLRTHQRSHSGLKKYACKYCSYRTKWKKELKNHEYTHTGFKPYICSFCDYRCVTSARLKSHVRVHTGEKPYTCKYCDFATAHRSVLRKHVAGHKGVFPFLCPYCSYKTQHQTNLNHHVMCHEDNKPHKCPHCAFRFISISELNSHMRTHTGEKPFACDLCGFRCAAMPSLKNHLKDCDPARYRSLNKLKKNGIKRLHCVEEGSHRLAGVDLEGITLDDLSLGGSISSFSSNEEIVNLTSQPAEVQKNARNEVKNDVSNSQSERIKCAYAFFDNDTFIGEYSV